MKTQFFYNDMYLNETNLKVNNRNQINTKKSWLGTVHVTSTPATAVQAAATALAVVLTICSVALTPTLITTPTLLTHTPATTAASATLSQETVFQAVAPLLELAPPVFLPAPTGILTITPTLAIIGQVTVWEAIIGTPLQLPLLLSMPDLSPVVLSVVSSASLSSLPSLSGGKRNKPLKHSPWHKSTALATTMEEPPSSWTTPLHNNPCMACSLNPCTINLWWTLTNLDTLNHPQCTHNPSLDPSSFSHEPNSIRINDHSNFISLNVNFFFNHRIYLIQYYPAISNFLHSKNYTESLKSILFLLSNQFINFMNFIQLRVSNLFI